MDMMRSVTQPSSACHGIQCGMPRMSMVASTGSPMVPFVSKVFAARTDWS